MNRDLTVGNPGAVLRRFCLPLFGSVIFQQLYNIADSLVAGKFIGESALAAVGNSYEITMLFIAFAFGCNIGCSVVVSQLFGGRAYGEMKTAVTTTLIAAGALCLALMAGGLLGSRALLELIRTPEEVMDASRLYLDIYLWGLPFLFFYNIATGIFSALGDSRTPFLFLALSSTANIGVDILFVTAFDMGVAGVAWATFLCQGVSCLLALAVVFRRLARIPAEGRRPLFSASALGRVAAIAVPSILQQSFISVGYSAAVKLNNLVVTSFTTLGNGVSNFTAQNLGAGKTERIDQGFRAGLGLVWAVCLPVAAAYLLAGRQLLCLFIDAPTQTALDTGVTFLRLLSPFYFVVSAKLTADGVLRGTGSMGRFMAATFTDLILRVTLALVLSRTGLGATGIWLAWPIGWTAATVLSLLFYHTGPWRRPAGEP